MTESVAVPQGSAQLAPFVPRLVVDWLRHSPDLTYREVEGTLAFLDISGFTRLTERLARRGKEGAEEMSDLLNATFSTLLDVGYQDGAGLVKWGGDAVLLLFDGPGHASRAARAAFRMRATLREVGRLQTSAGSVVLRMSAGIHTGRFHFFLVGDPDHHRELLIAGPAASLTAEMESEAKAGEIAVSSATAALLDPRCSGAVRGDATLLRAEPDIETVGIPPAKSVEGLDLSLVIPRGLRDHLLDQHSDAEHRTISVGFVEFSGTDAVLRDDGPSALAEALDDVVINVQHATDRYGVTFFESDISQDGGKIMLTAGAPVSHGHDDDRMMRVARQVIESAGRLPLRIGINRGSVFSGDFGPPFRRTYSVKGDAINLAARVMTKADSGQVLATKAVAERALAPFTLTEIPPFMVKGKLRPIEALIVGSPGSAGGTAAAPSELRSRGSEIATLRDAVSRAVAGSGSVTLIEGQRGSGRSRLLAELPVLAAPLPLLTTTCQQYDVAVPYLAIRRLLLQAMDLPADADDTLVIERLNARAAGHPDLRPWLPLIGVVLGVELPPTPESSGLDEDFRKPRMEAATIQLLEQLQPEPAVFVVDDVHNIDQASHDLLSGILDVSKRHPWAIFLTVRSGTDHQWAEASTTVIQLSPLSSQAAMELVAAETEEHPLPPTTIEMIVERSAGNPLFLQGLLNLAKSGGDLDGLPESVEDLVTAEIDRLSPSNRRILRYAAVLGTSVDEDLLARMLGNHWVSARSSQFAPLRDFLTPAGPGTLQFTNSLIRDVAYEGLPFRRRRDLHQQAGSALLDRLQVTEGAVSDEAERLAWHFHLADRASETWQYARMAADQALAQFAQTEAARFLRWSAQAGLRLDVPRSDLAEVLETLGDTQFTLGLSSDARRSYQQAARAAADDPVRAANVQLKLGRLDQRIGQLSQSLRRLTRGISLVADIQDPRARAIHAELATRYAIGRFQQGRFQDAKKWGDNAIDIAEQSGDLLVLANAHNALEAITLWSGIPSDIEHGRVALGLYEELNDVPGQGHSLNNLAIRAIFEGRWDETQPLLSRAAALFEQIGDVSSLAAALYNQADVLVRQGRSADAEPLLTRALRIARGVDDDETVALVLRDWGKASARAGDFERSEAQLAEAIVMLEQLGEPQELLDAEAARAECALLKGDPVDALHLTEGALKRGADNASVLPTLHRVQGFALLALDDNVAAKAAFEAGLELQEPAARHEQAFLTVGRAEVATRLNEPEATALYEQGVAMLHTLGVITPPFPAGLVRL
ncbi:MAG TPA: adenylate/guanylate cyclase domain-containing protein [Actinomycetes bacterium]|nr:adenylate/guanylate cyclase domain-containing protein [Actinomycetes bacterium]